MAVVRVYFFKRKLLNSLKRSPESCCPTCYSQTYVGLKCSLLLIFFPWNLPLSTGEQREATVLISGIPFLTRINRPYGNKRQTVKIIYNLHNTFNDSSYKQIKLAVCLTVISDSDLKQSLTQLITKTTLVTDDIGPPSLRIYTC